ncbi:hypothetical protein CAEBREN_28368 [Caenorhabditis brenneri]|uniref:Uncharacterized protein n=1 Tax=Caenorhabditis brenneri TaxID=135651 RepID=G0NEU2_CAEBE|nr:hypothetical protein CAEBREN_28368 [Caenorhabditis brenneri]
MGREKSQNRKNSQWSTFANRFTIPEITIEVTVFTHTCNCGI